MALEDLFNMVKDRLRDDSAAESKGGVAVPKNMLFKCPRCAKVHFAEDFEKLGKVCTCGYHARLSAAERLRLVADNLSFSEYDRHMKSKNPIGFDGYEEKLQDLRAATGLRDAIVTGECEINGEPCIIGIMDSRFMMASMGSVVGEKVARAFEQATAKRLPVVLFTASGGARMQEGIISLMQMAKTSAAVKRHSDAGLLYITVLTDPTTGGVTEGTIRQRLPDDFQSAEFLEQHGFVDAIVPRTELRRTLAKLLKYHRQTALPQPEGEGRS